MKDSTLFLLCFLGLNIFAGMVIGLAEVHSVYKSPEQCEHKFTNFGKYNPFYRVGYGIGCWGGKYE